MSSEAPCDLARTANNSPSRLWWLYFALLAIIGVLGIIPFVQLVLRPDRQLRELLVGIGSTTLNVCGIAGLWCFIRSRPLGASWFWKSCLALTAGQYSFAAYQFGRAFMPVAPYETMFPIRGERIVSLLGLGSMLLAVPLLFALWRYAFRSPRVWEA